MMARALPSDNRLLSTVPLDDLQLLTPLLQLVAMTLGEMVFEPDQAQQFLYFPTSAIVSLHYVTESGASAESCSVGSEGVVGAPIFMGGVSTSSSAVVTRSGMAYRLPQQAARSEIRRCAPLQRILLRHTSSLIAQTIQIAACNRFHSVSQTLCRWLLTTLDRSSAGDDPGIAGQHSRRQAREHHGSRLATAGRGLHSLPPRPHPRDRPCWPRSGDLRMLQRAAPRVRNRHPSACTATLIFAARRSGIRDRVERTMAMPFSPRRDAPSCPAAGAAPNGCAACLEPCGTDVLAGWCSAPCAAVCLLIVRRMTASSRGGQQAPDGAGSGACEPSPLCDVVQTDRAIGTTFQSP